MSNNIDFKGAVSVIFDSNGSNSTLSGQFINYSTPSGNFIKTGLGSLTLNSSAASTATVGLKVNAGTLDAGFFAYRYADQLVAQRQALTLGGGTLISMERTGITAATAQTFPA